MQRVAVALRNKYGHYKVPKFSECLVDFFTKDSNSVMVNFSYLENGLLLLSESDNGFELRHSPYCPIKLWRDSSLLESDKNKIESTVENVRVASSFVIESADSHILMTLRSSKMRSSPNVWVFPGGHLELYETMSEAGIREVKEETGLDICDEQVTVLGFWENVYPLTLGSGSPIYHVLIGFHHVKLQETHKELTEKIIGNSDEVASYCWLNYNILHKILECDKDEKLEGKQYVCDNGILIGNKIDYNKMFFKPLITQSEPYSGTSYGMKTWIKLKNREKSFCRL